MRKVLIEKLKAFAQSFDDMFPPELPIGNQTELGDVIRCPECGSTMIAKNRQPDGDNVCVDCRHRWK